MSRLCSARPTPQLPPVSCPQQFLGLFCLSVRLLTGDSYLGLPWSWKTPCASPFSGHTSHRGHSPPTRAASRKTNKKKKTHSYHSPESFPRSRRRQMTQPWSLAHPRLQRQTTRTQLQPCSEWPLSPFPACPCAHGAQGAKCPWLRGLSCQLHVPPSSGDCGRGRAAS